MAKRKAKVSVYDVADRIAAMECEDDIQSFGPKVLEIMKGVSREIFIELDEKPGLFDYMPGKDGLPRFYMLRRVRNDEEYGQYLFQGLA